MLRFLSSLSRPDNKTQSHHLSRDEIDYIGLRFERNALLRFDVEMAEAVVTLPRAEDVKVIMTDVDGTFLTDTHQVHPRTRDAVKYLRENHPEIPIIVTTGKQRHSCEWFINELGLSNCPTACCHGSIIHAPGGKILDFVRLDSITALKIVEECRRVNKTCFLFTTEGLALVNEEENSSKDWVSISKQFDRNLMDVKSSEFLDHVRLGKVDIIKATVIMDVAEIAATKVALCSALSNSKVDVTQALPFILEIIPAGTNKSIALHRFCKDFDCSPTNVLAFGDGLNDLEMLRTAGAGVAMGNAHEEVIKVAKYKTLTNNEGGVGVFLDKIFRSDHHG